MTAGKLRKAPVVQAGAKQCRSKPSVSRRTACPHMRSVSPTDYQHRTTCKDSARQKKRPRQPGGARGAKGLLSGRFRPHLDYARLLRADQAGRAFGRPLLASPAGKGIRIAAGMTGRADGEVLTAGPAFSANANLKCEPGTPVEQFGRDLPLRRIITAYLKAETKSSRC